MVWVPVGRWEGGRLKGDGKVARAEAGTAVQGCAHLLPLARRHRARETQLCCLQEDVKATLLPPAFSRPLSGWSACSENCCFVTPHPVFSPSCLPLFHTSSLFRAPHSIVPLLFYHHNKLHFFCIIDHFLATQIPPQSTLPTCLVCPQPSFRQEPIHRWAEETGLVCGDYFYHHPSSWGI